MSCLRLSIKRYRPFDQYSEVPGFGHSLQRSGQGGGAAALLIIKLNTNQLYLNV